MVPGGSARSGAAWEQRGQDRWRGPALTAACWRSATCAAATAVSRLRLRPPRRPVPSGRIPGRAEAGGGGGAGSGRRTPSSWVPGWFYDKVPEVSFVPLGNSRLRLPGPGL